MSETTESTFKVIESQEELDNIVKERLKREREAANKRYEGWISPEDHQRTLSEANQTLEDYKKARENDTKAIEDLTAKNAAYETASLKSRIAHEVGLSLEWTGRISGEDEQSIRADAESLKKLVGTGTPLPTKNPESGENLDPSKTAFKSVLSAIKND